MDKEPKKVYVITKGAYSSYHICAVASDMETAEKLQKYYSDDEVWGVETSIEAYDLNEKPDDIRVMYCVIFRNNKVECRAEEYEHVEHISNGPIFMAVYVMAKDEAHAVKIAQDRRAEYLAKKEGVV